MTGKTVTSFKAQVTTGEMTLIIIVGEYTGRDGLYPDFKDEAIKTKNRREVELENGTRIKAKPPSRDALRGMKPDVIILKADVSKKFYNEILKPCIGKHGAIIDESKRTSQKKK